MEKENNNEIQPIEVVHEGNIYEGKSQEIVQYTDFQRVNFDDSISMINYGQDLIKEIGKYIEDVAMMRDYEVSDMQNAKKEIQNIFNFDSELSEIDKNKQLDSSAKLGSKIKQGLIAIKTRIKGDEPVAETYSVQFEKKLQEVKNLASSLESQLNKKSKNIGISNDYMSKMREYSRKLKCVIDAGRDDLAKYKQKIEWLKQQNMTDNNVETETIIRIGEQNIVFFESILIDLESTLATYAQKIEQEHQKQSGDLRHAFNIKRYLNSTIPATVAELSTMVGIRIQKQEVEQFDSCVEITNIEMQKNATALVDNLRSIGNRAKEGNITIETYQKIQTNIDEGYKLLEEIEKDIRNEEAKRHQIVSSIITSAEEKLKDENLRFLNENGAELATAFESHDYPQLPQKPKQKRFKLKGKN